MGRRGAIAFEVRMSSGRRFDSIQYLRGIAAIAVVVFHATTTGDRMAAAGLSNRALMGAACDDIVFGISGFIMWVQTRQRPTTPPQFATNHILPTLSRHPITTLA